MKKTEQQAWKAQLIVNKSGEYKLSIDNTVKIMENNPELRNLGGFDTAKQKKDYSW